MQRKILLFSIAFLALALIGSAIYWEIFGKTGQDGKSSSNYFDVSLDTLPAGEARRVDFNGQQYYILHRNARQIESLTILRPTLRDPDSLEVPPSHPSLANDGRSPMSEYVVIDTLPSHSTCRVQFGTPTFQLKKGQIWAGGFYETCQRAGFDVAGRVLSTAPQEAKNLRVLRYQIKGKQMQVFVE